MSALTGETIVCGQHTGTDIQLRIFGDEFYARYETLDGYSVVYDKDYGGYCYALLAAGRFVSSGVPLGKTLPEGLRKHMREEPAVRNELFEEKYTLLRPREVDPDTSAMRTLGPDDGLLSGRKLSQGNIRGLTIIVDFDDITTSISREDVDEMFNAPNFSAHGNHCSVNQYFKTVSSGKLDYSNTVVGPVKLSRRRSHYISNSLVKEALDIAVAEFDLNLEDFDSEDEGIVDAINFLYAGDSQFSGKLWPHNSVAELQYGAIRTHYYQLVGIGSHTIDLRIGTICHENGHLLCRFPDMYDYGKRDGDFEKSQGIGRYCLMGSGNYLNGRRTPSPVCSYLRELAGWIDNVVLLNSPKKVTAQHGAYDIAFKYQTAIPNEYFMIENRRKVDLDAHLPSDGLAIYHCDTLGSNEWQDGTRNKHYQCALLQADGSLDLENNRNSGDSTDLFSNISAVAVSDATVPSSRMWNGSDSGLVVSEVKNFGQDISFTIGEPQDQPMVEAETFPNLLIADNSPAGVTSTLNIDSSGELCSISVTVEIIHSWISDLKITLRSPEGDEVILHNREGGDGDDILKTYDSETLAGLANYSGSEILGQWSLTVVDKASQDVGRLLRWSLGIQYERPSTMVTETAIPDLDIPDSDSNGISSAIPIQQDGHVKRVEVNVDIAHPWIGDLQVDLVSPSGHVVRLHNNTGESRNDLKQLYNNASTPGLNEFNSEPIQGDWRLRVRDLAPDDTGTLVMWSVTLEY